MSAFYNIESVRITALFYKLGFIVMFIMYYHVVYFAHAFSLSSFLDFLHFAFWTLIIVLLAQQFFIVIGIRTFPLVNLVHFYNRGIGANSLCIESSHAARIMTVLMLLLIQLSKFSYNDKGDYLRYFLAHNKRKIIFYLWFVFTMGSSTAILGLVLILASLVRGRRRIKYLIFGVISLWLILNLDFPSVSRVHNVAKVVVSFDSDAIIEEDLSAAARIIPVINTVTEINLADRSTWLGHGIDAQNRMHYLDKRQMISSITDYGILQYVFTLILVYSCCINRFFSTSNLIFLILLGASVNSVAYTWAILLLLSTGRYFERNYG